MSILAIWFEDILFLCLPCAGFVLKGVYLFTRFPSKRTKSDCLLASLNLTWALPARGSLRKYTKERLSGQQELPQHASMRLHSWHQSLPINFGKLNNINNILWMMLAVYSDNLQSLSHVVSNGNLFKAVTKTGDIISVRRWWARFLFTVTPLKPTELHKGWIKSSVDF